MDPCKVQTIVDWATLTSVQDVQCFLGFANFYERFITHYSMIMTLFIHLTRKDQPFPWGVEVENAFQSLKTYFMTAPLFIHADLSKPFVLEMDAFDFTLGVMLSQPGENNIFHLVGFHSHKFSFAKIDYKIHDKELLAIVDAFEEWRHLFEKAQL
jgi:hypothetical protein